MAQSRTNTARETRDLMKVESFSQLPFIRSTAPPPLSKEKQNAAGAIRLFGKEFGNSKNDRSDSNTQELIEGNKEGSDGTESSSSSRKFECHYCCRNFPTSQALGGHQNAHKRERQQAKRAHLQFHSTMLHATLPDPHLINYNYNYNYTRLGSASAPPPPLPMANYHSWTTNAAAQPINGSPLAFWHHTTPPFKDNIIDPHQFMKMKPLPSSITTFSASHLRFGYESKPPPEVQEHVSLDLHL